MYKHKRLKVEQIEFKNHEKKNNKKSILNQRVHIVRMYILNEIFSLFIQPVDGLFDRTEHWSVVTRFACMQIMEHGSHIKVNPIKNLSLYIEKKSRIYEKRPDS